MDPEWAFELPLEPLPDLCRLDVEAHLGLQAFAHVLGLGSRELVNRDLEVEASGIRPGRLAVQLAALDEHDLDSLTGQVVGERGSCEPAAHDEHVRALGERSRKVAPGQPGRRGDEIVGVVAQVSHE